VVHEQLTENDSENMTNLISAVRYADSLEKLHACIARHIEVTREAWQLNNYFRVSEDALREIERQRSKAGQNLLSDTRDPPSLN
jgi:Na+/phosphate symporter